VRDASVDLVVADPPYGLGKDYGNDSDRLNGEAYLDFSRRWIDAIVPKAETERQPLRFSHLATTVLKCSGHLKTRLMMVNEIIWDRKSAEHGGSTRKFFLGARHGRAVSAKSRDYYFDVDSVRIPYGPRDKKSAYALDLRGQEVARGRVQPQGRVERNAPASPGPGASRPSDAKAAGDHERMVLASSPPEGRVLDPFMGSGTTAVAAVEARPPFHRFRNQSGSISPRRSSASAASTRSRPVSAAAKPSSRWFASVSRIQTTFRAAGARAEKSADSVHYRWRSRARRHGSADARLAGAART